MSKVARHRIGIAGWSIPAALRDDFGEGASVLERYATRLDCVEVNSSFYRPHQRKTYERWAAMVPAGFRFSVKAPRTITHEHGLREVSTLLDGFVGECSGLGSKLGVVLIQLPASLEFDARIASTFFSMLRRRLSDSVHVVCEPRNESWSGLGASRLLERHNVNRVGADPDPIAVDAVPSNFGSCHYWRLHGAPRIYYSSYDAQALGRIAAQVRSSSRAVPAWVIFDNTAHGQAIPNAMELGNELLGVEYDCVKK